MSPAVKALLYRFLLGLVLVEIPVITSLLSVPTPDYRLLAIGLLGGVGAALEKYVAPYITGGLESNPSDVNAAALAAPLKWAAHPYRPAPPVVQPPTPPVSAAPPPPVAPPPVQT
jgi:hypothetical protein